MYGVSIRTVEMFKHAFKAARAHLGTVVEGKNLDRGEVQSLAWRRPVIVPIFVCRVAVGVASAPLAMLEEFTAIGANGWCSRGRLARRSARLDVATAPGRCFDALVGQFVADEHLRRLEHKTTRAIEESKVEMDRQVIVAEVKACRLGSADER